MHVWLNVLVFHGFYCEFFATIKGIYILVITRLQEIRQKYMHEHPQGASTYIFLSYPK